MTLIENMGWPRVSNMRIMLRGLGTCKTSLHLISSPHTYVSFPGAIKTFSVHSKDHDSQPTSHLSSVTPDQASLEYAFYTGVIHSLGLMYLVCVQWPIGALDLSWDATLSPCLAHHSHDATSIKFGRYFRFAGAF